MLGIVGAGDCLKVVLFVGQRGIRSSSKRLLVLTDGGLIQLHLRRLQRRLCDKLQVGITEVRIEVQVSKLNATSTRSEKNDLVTYPTRRRASHRNGKSKW